MDLINKILELDSVYEGDGQRPGSFETNNPNEAIKEIVRRMFPGVTATVPISENLQLNLGPGVNEISAGGQFDVGGGELSIGGGMSGDDKAFGIRFRKQFSNGSLSEEYYGKSQLAYQKAVKDGFQGTYEEYLRLISPTKSFADGGRAAFKYAGPVSFEKLIKPKKYEGNRFSKKMPAGTFTMRLYEGLDADGNRIEKTYVGTKKELKKIFDKKNKSRVKGDLPTLKDGEVYQIRQGKNKGKFAIRMPKEDKYTFYDTRAQAIKHRLDYLRDPANAVGGARNVDIKPPKGFVTGQDMLKEARKKGITVSENRQASNFADNFGFPKTTLKGKTFYDISKLSDPKEVDRILLAQVRSGAGSKLAKEKFPIKTKSDIAQTRYKAIEEKGGVKKDSPLAGKKKLKVDMGHAGNIFSNFSDELITLDKLTYTPSQINEILGQKGGVDDKIRAIQNSQFKVINKMNDADAAKYMDNNKIPYNKASSNFKQQLLSKSDATLTRLVLDSGGEKVARLSDGTTFGGSFLKNPVDRFDMYKGVTEQNFKNFRSKYLTNEGNLKPDVLTDQAKKTKIKLTDTDDFTNIIKQDLPDADKKNLIDLKIFEDNRIASMQSAKSNSKQIEKTLASLSNNPACAVFAGKRGKFQPGGSPNANLDDCVKGGIDAINSGKVPKEKATDFVKILKGGGTALRNLVKYGVLPEAVFFTADSLLRVGMGDTFTEAGLRASDYILPDDQTKLADVSKVSRIFGDRTGEIVGRSIDFKNQINKIKSLESQKESLEALNVPSDFGYTGDLTPQVKNMDANIAQAKKRFRK